MIEIRTLLFMDNNLAHAEFFRQALLSTDDPFQGAYVTTLSQGLKRLREKGVWGIFANLSLPDSQGLDTFAKLLHVAPAVPTLVMCGAGEGHIAFEAMRIGAKDFLLEGHINTYSFVRAIWDMAKCRLTEGVLPTETDGLSVALDLIGDAVLSTDISGNVIYLNVVAENMTGWSCGQAQGKTLTEVLQIIDGVTKGPLLNPLERAVQTGKCGGFGANCILIGRDQIGIFIEYSAAPIHDRAGSITGAMIVFHDVGISRAITKEIARLGVQICPQEPPELLGDDRKRFEKWPNDKMVARIGERIRQLRESRGMTQTQLQARSNVSRSFQSRFERGQMTPSLITLEKICEALGIGLNRFFIPESNGEALLGDPFIQELRLSLQQFESEHLESILKRLALVSNNVSSGNEQVRPLPPQPSRMEHFVKQINRAAVGRRH